MTRSIWGISVVAVFVGATAAMAEVPMHNPGLDHTCPKGFQYSRDTAACEQANCPPGAGRVYTLECNCGEAWSKPFRTCYADGLAVACVAAGAECPGDGGGFDPMTGDCKGGFMKEGDTCVNAWPEKLRCRVLDADGNPVAGKEVRFGEAVKIAKEHPWKNAQKLTSGADGVVEFTIADRKDGAVLLGTSGPDGMVQNVLDRDNQPAECELRVFDLPQFEAWTKREYGDFLKKACLGDDDVAKVNEIPFEPGHAGTPRYNDGKIEIGSITENYDELVKTMIHEISHGLGEKVLDTDKNVGGKHNNWVPVDPKDVNAGTPEQLAFEEATADFMAMLWFASKNKVYQDDLLTFDRAAKALEANGAGTGARTESVITAFLWEQYRPIIESGPDGPARALADFMKTMTFPDREHYFTDPARTIQEWVAAKIEREGKAEETGAPCGYSKLDVEKLRSAARAWFEPKPQVEIKGTEARDDLESLSMIAPGRHEVPPGATLAVDEVAADFASVTHTRVGGGAEIEMEGDGRMTIRRGTATVTDGRARTPELDIVPMGTELVVTVGADTQTVAVAHGGVEVIERAGQGRRVQVAAGQAVDYTAAGGFAAVRDGGVEIERARKRASASRATPAGNGAAWKKHLPWMLPLGGCALLLVIVLAVRRKG